MILEGWDWREVPFGNALGIVAPLRAGGELGGFMGAWGGVLGVFEVVHYGSST